MDVGLLDPRGLGGSVHDGSHGRVLLTELGGPLGVGLVQLAAAHPGPQRDLDGAHQAQGSLNLGGGGLAEAQRLELLGQVEEGFGGDFFGVAGVCWVET